ncbi:MAG: carbohydrate kinase [Psychroserpens sp.]|uniref:carbohydrate kinase family protein n=1 Tax=Psychroserpens sp. TaxID=2020870 RepID=UPI003CBDCEB1
MNKVICFGEVLWDIFPKGKYIGGAPFNVARQMLQYGFDCQLISAIGNDDLGKDLLGSFEAINFSSESIQKHENLATGTVIVKLDKSGSATYAISKPVAWDAIEMNAKTENLVVESEVFIFGSLAARSSISRSTLLSLLNLAKFKVFDANLRAPHYNLEDLRLFMSQSNLIKLNDEELVLLTSNSDPSLTVEQRIMNLYNIYQPEYIAVTLGDQGAILYCNATYFRNSGYTVQIKDTVGAGDAFLAMLVSELKMEAKPQSALDRSCAVGALVASKAGANPKISKEDIAAILRT